MTDAAPELLEALEARFRGQYESDRALRDVFSRVESGAANYADAARYAGLVSRDLTLACASVLTDEALPDGRLYYNIADRVLRPMIGEQTELISDVCRQTQEALNRAAGLGMKAVRVQAEPDRVQGIVQEAADAERFSDVSERVYSHIDNLGRHVVDESVRQNADAQWKAGLGPKVVRTSTGQCCDWCEGLAGAYDYADVRGSGSEVWQRHANCGCLIEYDPGDGRRETVNNYRFDREPEEIERRIEASKALTRDVDPDAIAKRKAEEARLVARMDEQQRNRERWLKLGSPSTITTDGGEITVRRLDKYGYNNLFVDKNVNLTERQIRKIDWQISEARRLVGGSGMFDAMVVVTDIEGKLASYNPVNNTLLISSRLTSDDEIIKAQAGFACQDDPRSTAVHELLHWKDADEYRRAGNSIEASDLKSPYIQYRCGVGYEELSKAGFDLMDGKQISDEISEYAWEKIMFDNDFDEAYTEYRTKLILG